MIVSRKPIEVTSGWVGLGTVISLNRSGNGTGGSA